MDQNIPKQQSFNEASANQASDLNRGNGLPFLLQNRWEVISHLGQGGMGTVYLALDLRLAKRHCVVKKLRDDFFREEDKEKALAFFQREAIVLSRLQHPNIVHILDCFQESGDNYLVMEYVDGENLHQMLYKRGEPFLEDQVLTWASQICDVLQFMHSNDPPVIYRDLKPSNVMIDSKGRVKLVDFGIARHYADDGDNTHVVSAGYSPPEQYWGQADCRSDIYALGATMHFLLTGQEPLALKTCSPNQSNSTVSSFTNQIVVRATDQDPWLRYQLAPEMKEDLDHRFQTQTERKKPADWLAPLMYVSAVFLACMALITFLKLLEVHNQTAGYAHKQLDQLDLQVQSTKKQFEDFQNKNPELLSDLTAQELRAETRPFASNPNGSVAPTVDLAFKEEDEAQLTDPEGLIPIEESPKQLFSMPFFNQFGQGNADNSN